VKNIGQEPNPNPDKGKKRLMLDEEDCENF
jgi:hypothetical protein